MAMRIKLERGIIVDREEKYVEAAEELREKKTFWTANLNGQKKNLELELIKEDKVKDKFIEYVKQIREIREKLGQDIEDDSHIE